MLQTVEQPQRLTIPGQDEVHLEHLAWRGVFELAELFKRNKRHFDPYRTIRGGDEYYTAEDTIQIAAEDFDDNKSYHYGIVHRITGLFEDALVGLVVLDCHGEARRKASLSYCIDKAFEGRGIVAASARRLCQMGFAEGKLSEILVNITPENESSQRVVYRLGGVLLPGTVGLHQEWSIIPARFEEARLAA